LDAQKYEFNHLLKMRRSGCPSKDLKFGARDGLYTPKNGQNSDKITMSMARTKKKARRNREPISLID
jgi:hypothetical protein